MADIVTKASDGDVTIVGTGALDLYVAADFQRRLYDACESADSVTVDLRLASFIDSSIESRLAKASAKMQSRDKSLRILLTPGAQPGRGLRLMGFDNVAELVEE